MSKRSVLTFVGAGVCLLLLLSFPSGAAAQTGSRPNHAKQPRLVQYIKMYPIHER